MQNIKQTTLIVLTLLLLLDSTSPAKPAPVLLQEGLYQEEMEGNLQAAMTIYEQIISDPATARSHAAQAMYRLGVCYLKNQDQPQAKATFEDLISRFSEQTSIIEKVQPLLDEMTCPDPAALMPADTMVYVEIGSPGRQIETILNMLKGTPFANPLALMGAAVPSGQSPDSKSPGQILSALLNPSMIAEFKKIRGYAVGILDIKTNNPPLVITLFPGKSDALRGIILAALGVLGQPTEPIEGMQTLIVAGQAGVAHDDDVIIIAQPLERLTWCVKQYKGITHEPTLASENAAFARLSRKTREQDALTVWIDVDRAFARISQQFSQGNTAQQLRIVDALADLKNIDDAVAHLSIDEKNPAFEATVNFKDGHRCLVYDLIRTPHLNREAFAVLPPEAIALASVALSAPDDAQTQKIHSTLKNLTGLDIGREVFANIEQITLFAVPPTEASNQMLAAKHLHPILPCLGLALTSHDPVRTATLLDRLLAVADLMQRVPPAQRASWHATSKAGPYCIGKIGNELLYCHLGRTGNSSILTLNPEILQACRQVSRSGGKISGAQVLRAPLQQLKDDTSKLALVNVGGAVQMAQTHFNKKFTADPNAAEKFSQIMGQLAETFENTSVQFQTNENLNRLNVRLAINGLPPLGSVFPLIMQLQQAMPKLQPTPQASVSLPVLYNKVAGWEEVNACAKQDIVQPPGAASGMHYLNLIIDNQYSMRQAYLTQTFKVNPLSKNVVCKVRNYMPPGAQGNQIYVRWEDNLGGFNEYYTDVTGPGWDLRQWPLMEHPSPDIPGLKTGATEITVKIMIQPGPAKTGVRQWYIDNIEFFDFDAETPSTPLPLVNGDFEDAEKKPPPSEVTGWQAVNAQALRESKTPPGPHHGDYYLHFLVEADQPENAAYITQTIPLEGATSGRFQVHTYMPQSQAPASAHWQFYDNAGWTVEYWTGCQQPGWREDRWYLTFGEGATELVVKVTLVPRAGPGPRHYYIDDLKFTTPASDEIVGTLPLINGDFEQAEKTKTRQPFKPAPVAGE